MSEGVFLGQLQAFIEIARLGNFTRASDSLFLTQPALSSRLKRLEHEVGGPLLVRDHKGARLTDAGRAFLPYAEHTVTTMLEGQQAVTDAMRGLTGDVVVAATSTLSTYILPSVIKMYLADNPNVRLSLRSALSEDIVEIVLSGAAQVGLARSLQHPDLECIPLYEEEYVLAVDQSHPLATASDLVAADLAGQTFITLFRSMSYREFIQNIFRHNGTAERSVIDVDNPEAGKKMINESLGVGLVPKTAIVAELEAGSLVRLQLADIPPMQRAMAALHVRGAPELASVLEFLELVRTRLKDVGLTPIAS